MFSYSLILNIIYTANTLEMLWPMTQSIVTNSDAMLRLVSNGCTDTEIDFVKKQASRCPKLDFYDVKSEFIKPHHLVLNELYRLDKESKYFCFMDSDILATGTFLESFEKSLLEHDAVFSCRPILDSPNSPEEELNRLQGRHFYNRTDTLVGGSYFAMYRRSSVDYIMGKYQVDFSRAAWSGVPDNARDRLIEEALNYQSYDTAKLLNVLLVVEGFSLDYFEHTELHHVGGLSWNRSILKDSDAEFQNKIEGIENPIFLSVLGRRRYLARYFSSLIEALVDKKELPNLPTCSSPVEFRRYMKVRNALIKVYKQDIEDTRK